MKLVGKTPLSASGLAYAVRLVRYYSRERLTAALLGKVDQTDCDYWHLSAAQWRRAVLVALVAQKATP